MTNYYTRRTADYSPLVVHFTKDPDRRMVKEDGIDEAHPLFRYKNMPAKNRLINILESRQIYASPMPFLPHSPQAVCFTECIWDALIEQAQQYSSYGVVISKHLIFEKQGGPALYIRGDSLRAIGGNIPLNLEPFIAPFDPQGIIKAGVPLDYLHEREWRLPESLTFEYSDIEFVIVDAIRDATKVVQQIGAQHIPEHKFIAMEVYRNIKGAWGEQ